LELPGVAKEVLQKLQPNLNYNSKVLELHEILELDCLATKLFGAAGVQLQSHADRPLVMNYFCRLLEQQDSGSIHRLN